MTFHSEETRELPGRTVIFLSGEQRSGKDTVAEHLVRYYSFQRYALADKLKDVACDLFEMKEKDRGLLIDVGRKMREVRPTVWLDYLWRTHVESSPQGSRIVIPDVRYDNECEFLVQQGGIPVRVFARLGVRRKRPGYNREFENDPTETALTGFPYRFLLDNSGSPRELTEQVDDMVEQLGLA